MIKKKKKNGIIKKVAAKCTFQISKSFFFFIWLEKKIQIFLKH